MTNNKGHRTKMNRIGSKKEQKAQPTLSRSKMLQQKGRRECWREENIVKGHRNMVIRFPWFDRFSFVAKLLNPIIWFGPCVFALRNASIHHLKSTSAVQGYNLFKAIPFGWKLATKKKISPNHLQLLSSLAYPTNITGILLSQKQTMRLDTPGWFRAWRNLQKYSVRAFNSHLNSSG